MVKTIILDKTYSVAQKELKKLKIEGALFKKLQAVKIAYEHVIKETAEFLGVFPVSIINWAKLINKDDLDSLRIGSKHKEGIKIKQSHKKRIRKWLEKDPNYSIISIKDKLEYEIDIKVSNFRFIIKIRTSYLYYAILGHPIPLMQLDSEVDLNTKI